MRGGYAVAKGKGRMMKLSEVELEIVKAARDSAQEVIPTTVDLGIAAAMSSLILLKDVLHVEDRLMKKAEVQPYLGLVNILREAAGRLELKSSASSVFLFGRWKMHIPSRATFPLHSLYRQVASIYGLVSRFMLGAVILL